MIDRALLRRLFLIAAILLLLSAGGALLAGFPRMAGGLALGFGLAALPFVTWAWIASRGMATRANRLLAAALVLVKLGIYAGALYLFVTRDLVNPVGVFVGLTAFVSIMTLGTMMRVSGGAKGVA